MPKLDPEFVHAYIEADEAAKLEMLLDLDTDRRELLIKLLDWSGVREQKPLPERKRRVRKKQMKMFNNDGTVEDIEVEEEIEELPAGAPVCPQPASEQPAKPEPGVLTRTALATPHLLAMTFDRSWENFPGPYMMVEQADILWPPRETAPYANRHINRVRGREHVIRGGQALQRTLSGFVNYDGKGLSWHHAIVHHEYDDEGRWYLDDRRLEATLQYRDGRVRLVIQSAERVQPCGRISARFANGRVIAGPIDISTWRMIVPHLPAIESAEQLVHYDIPGPESLEDREYTEDGYLKGERPVSAFGHLPRYPALPLGTWMSR